MATIGSNVIVLAGGFDLSCYLKSVDVTAEQDLLDSTALCTTGARTFERGLNSHTISGEGFFHYNASDDTLSINKFFSDAISTTQNTIYTVAPEGYSAIANGATSASVAYLANTKQAKHDAVKLRSGELIMTSFEAKSTTVSTTAANFGTGFLLWHGTQTGTGNSNYFDNAAGSTGYLAHLHVTSATVTSVVVKLQHSTDHSTWADLATFSIVSGNVAEQKFSTSTSVNRYVRGIITSWSGTSAVVSMAVKLGFTG